jgi:hypothetical protein
VFFFLFGTSRSIRGGHGSKQYRDQQHITNA